MLSPTINSDLANVFLKQFTKEVSHNVHVLLLWDQAGFHTSKKSKIPEDMTIVPLPPYSPELIPIVFKMCDCSDGILPSNSDLLFAKTPRWNKNWIPAFAGMTV